MDEITQVVELEYRGVYYLLKGTKETIAYLVNTIRALAKWKHELGLKKEGECSWEKIQEVSNGNPVLLNFPKEMFEKTIPMEMAADGQIELASPFEYYCRENKLRYCTMPDLNPNDGYLPIAVPAQDAGIHSEQIKHFMEKKVKAEEKRKSEYEEKIARAKDELVNARNDQQKEEAESKLQMLEEGKAQHENNLSETRKMMEKDNVLEFSEYLKMGKGTMLEKDPEMALQMEKVCGMVREYMPYECMYPIREASLVPDSGEVFYSQRAGEDRLRTVKRSFKTDDNGLVYSTYRVTDPKNPGNVHIFSDKGLGAEQWKEQLPKLLEEAGMMANLPTTAIRSESRLKAYIGEVEANFKRAPRSDTVEKTCMDEQTQQYMEQMVKEAKQRQSYENSKYTVIKVSSNSVLTDTDQTLALEVEDGLIRNIELVSMDEQEAVVRIKNEGTYEFNENEKMIHLVSGEEVLKKAGYTDEHTANRQPHTLAPRR